MTDKQKKNQKLDVSHIQMPLYSNWTGTIPASFYQRIEIENVCRLLCWNTFETTK